MDIERIIQVIPCVKPMIAVYEPGNDDEEYWFSWIYYLGLTTKGDVVPLDIFDGMFTIADEMSNFCGVYFSAIYLEEEPFYEKMKKWMEENKP